jgi:YD repeat-containing protein
MLNWSGASDRESGLSDMQYKVDSGTWASLGSSAASGSKVLTGLAAGQHTLYVRAKDAAGNYTASPKSLTYYYDSTVPFVQITGPSAGSYVSGTINITGSATDTYFKNYVVEYSRQSENSWTAIGTTQTAQVTNGTLAALNTAALADGVYKIRLTASDNAGSTSVTVQNITIDNTTESSNASITAPVVSALVDGTVDIWGTAFETNFSSAKLEYGASSSPTSWTTIATLSSAATTNSYLASWNTSSLSAGVYTIRLTVTDKTNHTVTKTVQVTLTSRTVIDNLGTSGYNPTADLALGSVNTVNGNFILGVTDLSVAQGKGPAINVSRTYNSLNKTCGLFGWGWTLSIPTLTVNSDNSVDIVTGDGYKLHYTYNSTTGVYTEAAGSCSAPLSYAALTCDSSTGIYTLAYKDDSKTLFDNTNGKVYEKDSLGNTLTYTITPGTITITDAVSRTVTLNIDTTYKHITSMTDFNVTGQGTRTWTYGYDRYGNLASVTAPGNKVTTYTYSPDTHNLLSIATPNEAAALAGDSSYTVKKHVYTYSGYKLATATDKLGIVTNVTYDTANSLTTVTGYYGLTEPKVLKYYYDSYGRLAKLTDALKDTIYTYGDSVNPYLSTKVEKKSGVTSLESESYTYDSMETP